VILETCRNGELKSLSLERDKGNGRTRLRMIETRLIPFRSQVKKLWLQESKLCSLVNANADGV